MRQCLMVLCCFVFLMPIPSSAETPVQEMIQKTPEGLVKIHAEYVEIKDFLEKLGSIINKKFEMDPQDKGSFVKIHIVFQQPSSLEVASKALLTALQLTGYTAVSKSADIISIIPLTGGYKRAVSHHQPQLFTDPFVRVDYQPKNVSAEGITEVIKNMIDMVMLP